MANFLIGVDGEAREAKFMYIGVDGVARRVKSAYIGVDGEARLFYGGFYLPAVNETIVSIGSGEYFNAATKYAPGTYEIQIAGAPSTESSFAKTNCFTIQTTINKVFQIFAICSTSATNTFLSDIGIVSSEGTIFGGDGGPSAGYSSSVPRNPWKQGALAWNAACCHFLPVNGVFGIDYLRCFHCGAPASGSYGGGGAYGGGAGGRGSYTYVAPSGGGAGRYVTGTGRKGSDGAGGTGGTGGTGTISGNTGTGMNGKPGNSGTGIGAGTATLGGVAWYNGTTWAAPTRSTNTSGAAYVRVIFKHA